MTKSNIWISGELLDQWMIVGGEECATFDLLWQLSHHSTSDGCAVICSCASTQLVYKNEWMSCGMAENRASLAELYKECTLTWNMKEQKKLRVIFYTAATRTVPTVKLINQNVNWEQQTGSFQWRQLTVCLAWIDPSTIDSSNPDRSIQRRAHLPWGHSASTRQEKNSIYFNH